MQNSEFANLTQTSNFYIQDLFQSIFLTGTQHQITQKCIISQQRMNYLIFFSFKSDLK